MATQVIDGATANGNYGPVKVGKGFGGMYQLQTQATDYDSGVVLPQVSQDGENYETALEEDGSASTGLGADGIKFFMVPDNSHYRLNVASVASAATDLNAWVSRVSR